MEILCQKWGDEEEQQETSLTVEAHNIYWKHPFMKVGMKQ